MQRKVVLKKKPRKLPRSRRPARPKSIRTARTATGYDDALLNGIIQNQSKQAVSIHALELTSLLSSLTPGMRDMQHKSGFSIGRALYRIYEKDNRYIWYEESVDDLVSFLESAGLGSIAYNVFPDTVSIRIYNRQAPNLGIPIHEFEGGIISGFVSAGRRQFTEIHEARCGRSGYKHCEFTRAPRQEITGVSEEHSVARLIASSLGALNKETNGANVPLEYYMLASSTLFRGEYRHALRNIASYIGNEFASAMHLTGNRSSIERAERLTRLLNLGSLTIKSLKPVDIQLEFDGLSSRREHVELSTAFLDGLLNRLIRDRAKIETVGARSANGYRVRLMERR